ncbi:LANO_0G01134g1_1 [Lachancea nothofagi CBS 11611]|uniref:LANO_0G01134g1_1 n=1 Tax=Lachancea nothofagi CBS 11611 TaxID=1266666 RepID=A0A1G4KEI6_9SACH|nr:LANO_0G01134g1_1 [Lachancea nothofagi CBS 11611]
MDFTKIYTFVGILFTVFLFRRFFGSYFNTMASPETVQKVKALIKDNKIFVASKTYCPYCQATIKLLFEDKKLSKEQVHLLQLDTMKEGAEIQDALQEITGQRSVPNIFISGKHIGGNSDLQALESSGKLDALLKKALA